MDRLRVPVLVLFGVVGALLPACSDEYTNHSSPPLVCVPGLGSSPRVFSTELFGALTAAEPNSSACSTTTQVVLLTFAAPDDTTFQVGLQPSDAIDWSTFVGTDFHLQYEREIWGLFEPKRIELSTIDEGLVYAHRLKYFGADVEDIVGPFTVDARGSRLGTQDDRCGKIAYFDLRVGTEGTEHKIDPGTTSTITTGGRSYAFECQNNRRLRDASGCEDVEETVVSYSVHRQ